MGQLFHVFTIVLAALHGVHQVEADMPTASGTSKKLEVIDRVGVVASGVGMALGVPVPPAALDAAIGGIVDGVAGLFNFFGIFKHKSPQPAG